MIYASVNIRDFDVFSDFFLVVNDPLIPAMAAIGHAAQNDFGDFEARLSQAHCGWRELIT